jgi:hypothetical protein
MTMIPGPSSSDSATGESLQTLEGHSGDVNVVALTLTPWYGGTRM